MSEELTPWFPHKVRPARSGYHDTRVDINRRSVGVRLYWDADRGHWCASPKSSVYGHMNFEQYREWRGLAKEPK
jgi:hypothetical protein